MAGGIGFYDIIAKIGADASGFDTALNGADKNAKQFQKAMNITMAAAAATFGLVVYAAADFEKTMANIGTILGSANQDKVKDYGDKLLEFGKSVPTNVGDLSEGLYSIISAVDPYYDHMEILKSSTTAAIAGVTDLDTAFKVSSSVIQGYGMSFDDINNVFDILFKVTQVGIPTFNELASSLGSTIPIASAMGVPLEEVAGIIATLGGVTGTTAEAATQLEGMMSALLKPTAELEKAFVDLGVANGQELINKFGGLQGAMLALKDYTEKYNVGIGDLIGRKEALVGYFATTGNLAETTAARIQAMYNATGSMAEAYEVVIATFSSQLGIFKNIIQTELIEYGRDNLLPFLTGILDALNDYPEIIGTVISFVTNLVLPLGALAAAIKIVHVGMGLAHAAAGLWASALGPLGIVIIGVTAAYAAYQAIQGYEERQNQKRYDQINDESKALIDLAGEYIKLTEVKNLGTAQSEQLAKLETDLATKLGITTEELRNNKESLSELILERLEWQRQDLYLQLVNEKAQLAEVTNKIDELGKKTGFAADVNEWWVKSWQNLDIKQEKGIKTVSQLQTEYDNFLNIMGGYEARLEAAKNATDKTTESNKKFTEEKKKVAEAAQKAAEAIQKEKEAQEKAQKAYENSVNARGQAVITIDELGAKTDILTDEYWQEIEALERAETETDALKKANDLMTKSLAESVKEARPLIQSFIDIISSMGSFGKIAGEATSALMNMASSGFNPVVVASESMNFILNNIDSIVGKNTITIKTFSGEFPELKERIDAVSASMVDFNNTFIKEGQEDYLSNVAAIQEQIDALLLKISIEEALHGSHRLTERWREQVTALTADMEALAAQWEAINEALGAKAGIKNAITELDDLINNILESFIYFGGAIDFTPLLPVIEATVAQAVTLLGALRNTGKGMETWDISVPAFQDLIEEIYETYTALDSMNISTKFLDAQLAALGLTMEDIIAWHDELNKKTEETTEKTNTMGVAVDKGNASMAQSTDKINESTIARKANNAALEETITLQDLFNTYGIKSTESIWETIDGLRELALSQELTRQEYEQVSEKIINQFEYLNLTNDELLVQRDYYVQLQEKLMATGEEYEWLTPIIAYLNEELATGSENTAKYNEELEKTITLQDLFSQYGIKSTESIWDTIDGLRELALTQSLTRQEYEQVSEKMIAHFDSLNLTRAEMEKQLAYYEELMIMLDVTGQEYEWLNPIIAYFYEKLGYGAQATRELNEETEKQITLLDLLGQYGITSTQSIWDQIEGLNQLAQTRGITSEEYEQIMDKLINNYDKLNLSEDELIDQRNYYMELQSRMGENYEWLNPIIAYFNEQLGIGAEKTDELNDETKEQITLLDLLAQYGIKTAASVRDEIKDYIDLASMLKVNSFEYDQVLNKIMDLYGTLDLSKGQIRAQIEYFERMKQELIANGEVYEWLNPIIAQLNGLLNGETEEIITLEDLLKQFGITSTQSIYDQIDALNELASTQGLTRQEYDQILEALLSQFDKLDLTNEELEEQIAYYQNLKAELIDNGEAWQWLNPIIEELLNKLHGTGEELITLNDLFDKFGITSTASIYDTIGGLEDLAAMQGLTRQEYDQILEKIMKQYNELNLTKEEIQDQVNAYEILRQQLIDNGEAYEWLNPIIDELNKLLNNETESVVTLEDLLRSFGITSTQSIYDQIDALTELAATQGLTRQEYDQILEKIMAQYSNLDLTNDEIQNQIDAYEILKQQLIDNGESYDWLIPIIEQLNMTLEGTTESIEDQGFAWEDYWQSLFDNSSQIDEFIKEAQSLIDTVLDFGIGLENTGADERIGDLINNMYKFLGTLDPGSPAYQKYMESLLGIIDQFQGIGGEIAPEIKLWIDKQEEINELNSFIDGLNKQKEEIDLNIRIRTENIQSEIDEINNSIKLLEEQKKQIDIEIQIRTGAIKNEIDEINTYINSLAERKKEIDLNVKIKAEKYQAEIDSILDQIKQYTEQKTAIQFKIDATLEDINKLKVIRSEINNIDPNTANFYELNQLIMDLTGSASLLEVQWSDLMKSMDTEYSGVTGQIDSAIKALEKAQYFGLNVGTAGLQDQVNAAILAAQDYLATLNPESQAYKDAAKSLENLQTLFGTLGGVIDPTAAFDFLSENNENMMDQFLLQLEGYREELKNLEIGFDVKAAEIQIDILREMIKNSYKNAEIEKAEIDIDIQKAQENILFLQGMIDELIAEGETRKMEIDLDIQKAQGKIALLEEAIQDIISQGEREKMKIDLDIEAIMAQIEEIKKELQNWSFDIYLNPIINNPSQTPPPTMHTGGIVYAHSGLLAPDETMAILQDREVVIPRDVSMNYSPAEWRSFINSGDASTLGGGSNKEITGLLKQIAGTAQKNVKVIVNNPGLDTSLEIFQDDGENWMRTRDRNKINVGIFR